MTSLYWRGTLTIIIIAGIIGLYKIETASAQLSISVFPVSFKASVDPGQTWEGTVTIVNPNDFPIKAVPEKENLTGGAEGEIRLIGEGEMEYSLASWISYDDKVDEFLLAAHERKPVNFKIIVPANVQPGGHYGAVLFRAKPVDASSEMESGVAISGRVGSILLFEVSGDVKKTGEITEIDVPRFLAHGPVDLSFKVSNGGNTYFTTEGRVEFRNLWSKFDGMWEPKVVFQGYDRTFKTKWPKKFLFGPVSVKIVANMENGPALNEKEILIWVLPWQETLVVLAFALMTFIGLITFKKKFRIVRGSNKNSAVR